MYSLHRLLFIIETGSSLPILEMCGFWFWQFSGCGDHNFQQISTKSHTQIKFSNADFVFNGEWNRKNRNRILEMCKFRIWLRLIITSTILYRFSPNFACGSEMWSLRFRLVHCRTTNLIIRNLLRIFTKFCTLLGCGQLEACCFCEKPELDFRF